MKHPNQARQDGEELLLSAGIDMGISFAMAVIVGSISTDPLQFS
jgi:hypothetical protein